MANSVGSPYYQSPERSSPKSDYSHCRILHETQCGFRPKRGTADISFVARQGTMQDKCREQRCDLYFAFIDVIKAFVSVKREAFLWPP